MPGLVDTTIRVLGQEPLAGRLPNAELLRLAEILDGAGFAYLEVSGGGVFDSAVRRGVESPWEKIRALKERTTTPLAMALRGRFLVGSHPVGGDFARRFVASAADSGIDVFRIHDPLNDVSNLREAAEAIVGAGREFDAGLVYGSGMIGALAEQARKLPELGASRILLHDPTGSLQPHRAGELIAALREASGLPVGLHCQGAGGAALVVAIEAVRAGADLVACAAYPIALTLHRVGSESLVRALEGLGHPTGIDVDSLWRASDLIDEHLGDEPVPPLPPRVAVRAAEFRIPVGLVAGVEASLRAHGAADRLPDVLAEVQRVREEIGAPPLAAPIGQIVASQALLNVLSSSRWTTVVDEVRSLVAGRFGQTPGPVNAAVARAVELIDAQAGSDPAIDLDALREQYEGIASSEEELLLLALFGDEAEALLRTIRARHAGGELLVGGGVDRERAERIRELVRMVQETGVGEITVEEDGMRVSVRRTAEPSAAPVAAAIPIGPVEPGELPPVQPPANGAIRVEAPMVGTFYRASQPGAPSFVEVGDTVAAGQTLCILEAMKLMNEIKAEGDGVVRAIHVENAQPVEFGQLLFELEPVSGRPLDAI
jgi:oxaloacetate decarboxylase (Na+ extruding) subunit alpha